MSNLSIEELEQILVTNHVQCGDAAAMARELIASRQRIAALENQLSIPVRLPSCSSSPVCEIEAGYANGINDSKEAIRRAGYLIEGDE